MTPLGLQTLRRLLANPGLRRKRQGAVLRQMRRDALDRTQGDVEAITRDSEWPGVTVHQSRLSRLEDGTVDLSLLELESLARVYGFEGREHEMIHALRSGTLRGKPVIG